MGDEGAVGARDDAHGQAGAARRLRAGDREQQRVPGAVGRDTVEEQVVDRGREHNGFEVRAGEPGQRMQLTDGIAVARAGGSHAARSSSARSERAGRTGTNSAASASARLHGVEHPRLACTAKGSIY